LIAARSLERKARFLSRSLADVFMRLSFDLWFGNAVSFHVI
jgi:hypothetical protein